MAEYIEREALLKFIENGLNNLNKLKAFGHDAVEILAEIQHMPTADVAPVVNGRWLDGKCTNCTWETPDSVNYTGYEDEAWILTNYCPNCGARMDGECR